jgi:DNA polymerase I-like protein with 3'-5' exonuclease and polymerase domains
MARKERQIDSLKKLQRSVPSIVKAINADEELGIRAAANPVLAMEELGYTLADKVRLSVERRIRFSVETFEQLETLAKQIHEIAGRRFSIDSPDELAHVLFEELQLSRPRRSIQDQCEPAQLPSTTHKLPTTPLPPQVSWGTKVEDPLDELRGAHPIMEPLLAYRKLEASKPRLASPELYDRIKRGEVELPAIRLRARLQRGPTPE